MKLGILERLQMVAFLILAAVSCGGRAESTGEDASAEAPLVSFAFPTDGVPNNNGYVGPFCCTGKTGIVKDAKGAAIGYAYFYGFGDGGVNFGDKSGASTFSVHVAARSNLTDPSSPLSLGEIDFAVEDLKVGVAKSAIVGSLEFEVVIDHVDIVLIQDQSYFDMQSIAASVLARIPALDGS